MEKLLGLLLWFRVNVKRPFWSKNNKNNNKLALAGQDNDDDDDGDDEMTAMTTTTTTMMILVRGLDGTELQDCARRSGKNK